MGLFHRNKLRSSGVSKVATSLQNEKQKAEIIINSVDDAVVLVDKDRAIQMFNPAAAKMTGWTEQEAQGLDYRSVLQFTDDKKNLIVDHEHPYAKVLKTGEVFRDNTAILARKDGKSLPVDVNISPLLDTGGVVSGAVGILRDVEAQRREEQQHADFISTASHEMRTPVAAIEGYLALALNDKVANIDAKARSYLEKAHSSTQHLGQLFQDLLTSSRAEDGRLANHPVIIEMSDFTEKLVEDLRFSAEKKGLLLELLMGGHERTSTNTVDVSKKVIRPLLYTHADPDRLQEVVTNLFDNAVKYTESGRISIGITGDDRVVQFHISDTGPGIPKDDIPHLFQKFYRVDNTSTRTIGGSGLGLYICRKIVELYDGRIWVESELDKGSTFYINLPRINSEKAIEMKKAEETAKLT